jgi:uncharacterized protein (DUF952 family)
VLTYHGAPRSAWEAQPEADYLPEAFAADGFIHTSVGAETLAAALNRYLKDDLRPYVALLIDLDRVRARWDVSRYDGDLSDYPHIHGPLNRDAVLRVLPLRRGADGSFLPPVE